MAHYDISLTIDVICEKIEEVLEVPDDKEKLKYETDNVKEALTDLNEKNLKEVKACLEGIGKAICKLTSNDPKKQMSGVLDIVASVTVFIPEIGPVISGVCLLISNVILAFGGKSKGTDMSAVFEHVLEKVIGKYHDDDVKAEASGIKFKLENMLTFLGGYVKTASCSFTEQNAMVLASHVMENKDVGTECLGKLEHYIRIYSVNKDSEDEDAIEHQAKCAIDYIEAYLEISSIRQLLLSVYYCILLTADTTGEYGAVTKGVLEMLTFSSKKDKEIAGIAPVEFTTPDRVVLASVFNLSENPNIAALNQTADSVIKLNNKIVQIKPKKWPERHLFVRTHFYRTPWNGVVYRIHDARVDALVCSGAAGRRSSCFTFQKSQPDNKFICEGQTRNYKHDLTKWGNFGFWKLIRMFETQKDPDTQLYLIASANFPTRFLRVGKNSPETTVGDPGEGGYWYLTEADVYKAYSLLD